MKTEILESLLQSVNALTQTLNLLLNEQSETPPQSTSSTATLTTSERLKKQEAAKAKAAAKKAATKTASETPKDTKDPKPAESEASEPLTVGEVKKLAGTYVSSHSLAEFKELMVGLDIKDISAADKAGRLQEIVDAINADE
ncbi:MAG: hypothetical protein P1U85_19150 [Verrucomicrobiales bacterium]|jgi:hypothetical protein|nr:hypothetical protein [Verrucomicrobiales bacterium]MDF1852964.1 hypothetical protein [Verrucomicrobiales bacterium]